MSLNGSILRLTACLQVLTSIGVNMNCDTNMLCCDQREIIEQYRTLGSAENILYSKKLKVWRIW